MGTFDSWKTTDTNETGESFELLPKCACCGSPRVPVMAFEPRYVSTCDCDSQAQAAE